MAHTQGRILVFGTDAAGFHKTTSAGHAMRFFGAQYAVAKGRTGNAYGIVLFTAQQAPLPVSKIAASVVVFIEYATNNPTLSFDVVNIGSGAFGFNDNQLCKLFKGTPDNVVLPDGWRETYVED